MRAKYSLKHKLEHKYSNGLGHSWSLELEVIVECLVIAFGIIK